MQQGSGGSPGTKRPMSQEDTTLSSSSTLCTGIKGMLKPDPELVKVLIKFSDTMRMDPNAYDVGIGLNRLISRLKKEVITVRTCQLTKDALLSAVEEARDNVRGPHANGRCGVLRLTLQSVAALETS